MDEEPNSSPQRSQRVSGRDRCLTAAPKSMWICVDGTGRSVAVRDLVLLEVLPESISCCSLDEADSVVVEVGSFP
jgi:hypothetical protein